MTQLADNPGPAALPQVPEDDPRESPKVLRQLAAKVQGAGIDFVDAGGDAFQGLEQVGWPAGLECWLLAAGCWRGP